MGKRGPGKTPIKIVRLQGNPGKRDQERVEQGEIQAEPVSKTTEPPISLTSDERAKWDRIVYNLEQVKLLTHMDLDALARYCKMLALYDELDVKVKEEGTIEVRYTKFGESIVEARHYTQWMALNRDLLRLEREFGLTPSARASMVAPLQGESKGDFEDFMNLQMRKAKEA